MYRTEGAHKQNSLKRIKTATIMISLIALAAILLSAFAFMQKQEADEQTRLAKRNMKQALQQQKIALEQRNIADSSKEQAMQQRELALSSEKRALLQRQIADDETRKAEENRLEALKQQYLAKQQKILADEQTKIAETNAAEAKKQRSEAEIQRTLADGQKQVVSRMQQLSESRKIAREALGMINEHRYDSSRDRAMEAFLINNINNGPYQNSDVYDALNINWSRSISNRNQFNFHTMPVHCVSGIPGTNIILTADESGMLYESAIKDNGVQKIAGYSVKEEVRVLSILPDGQKCVVLTALGNGFILNVSPTGMSLSKEFKFAGTGKAIAFDMQGNMILLSNKGITKYPLDDITKPNFIPDENISCITTDFSGRIYLGKNKEVIIYNDWNDIAQNKAAARQQYDSRVTSVATDINDQFMAAGTYNGYVWVSNLKSNTILWYRALHLSSVNDLKFARIDANKLQLASAGADQLIRLIDINSIAKRDFSEDILTLKGHGKWIYALYYAENGKWLCSTGEDNKVIAWKPTMNDLYKTLSD